MKFKLARTYKRKQGLGGYWLENKKELEVQHEALRDQGLTLRKLGGYWLGNREVLEVGTGRLGEH